MRKFQFGFIYICLLLSYSEVNANPCFEKIQQLLSAKPAKEKARAIALTKDGKQIVLASPDFFEAGALQDLQSQLAPMSIKEIRDGSSRNLGHAKLEQKVNIIFSIAWVLANFLVLKSHYILPSQLNAALEIYKPEFWEVSGYGMATFLLWGHFSPVFKSQVAEGAANTETPSSNFAAEKKINLLKGYRKSFLETPVKILMKMANHPVRFMIAPIYIPFIFALSKGIFSKLYDPFQAWKFGSLPIQEAILIYANYYGITVIAPLITALEDGNKFLREMENKKETHITEQIKAEADSEKPDLSILLIDDARINDFRRELLNRGWGPIPAN